MTNQRLLLLSATAAALAAFTLWSDDGRLLQRLTGYEPAAAIAGQRPKTKTENTAETGPVNIVLNPLHGIGIGALSEMVDRPLFNPTRAPAPKAKPAEAEPAAVDPPAVVADTPPPADFTLQAVALGETGRYAVVRANGTGEIFHVKQGQLLSDWQVKEVGNRAITLMRQDQSLQLKLFEAPVEPPAQQPETAPIRPRPGKANLGMVPPRKKTRSGLISSD